MTLDLARLAASANRAPSVHNTQPTRWSLGDDGALWLTADLSRQLAVGDTTGRDLRISFGAALEGTLLALGQQGLSIREIDLASDLAARLEIGGDGTPDALDAEIDRRCTWRKGFAPAQTRQTQALDAWTAQQGDLTLVADRHEIELISTLNERTSLAFYRHAPYRHELLSWMRLGPSDPNYGRDGLSASALGLSRFEAFGAGLVLGDPGFSMLDRFGLVAPLISETSRTRSAAAILLFHRPDTENPVDTGRVLYRHLLQLSALGFQTWPMSVLADDPQTAAELSARYGLPGEDRLITAWRVGPLPAGAKAKRERLPAEALMAV